MRLHFTACDCATVSSDSVLVLTAVGSRIIGLSVVIFSVTPRVGGGNRLDSTPHTQRPREEGERRIKWQKRFFLIWWCSFVQSFSLSVNSALEK